MGPAKTNWRRVTLLVIAVACSAIASYLLKPTLANNKDAINTVVTIFSILAGFLIAVISFVSEPVLKRTEDWQELVAMKRTIKAKLRRHNALFYFYLLTLALAIALHVTPQENEAIRPWLEYAFIFLASFVFLASFSLPSSLAQIQMDRYEAALTKSRPPVVSAALETLKKGRGRDEQQGK